MNNPLIRMLVFPVFDLLLFPVVIPILLWDWRLGKLRDYEIIEGAKHEVQ